MTTYFTLTDPTLTEFNPGNGDPVILQGYSTPVDDPVSVARIQSAAQSSGVNLLSTGAPLNPLLPASPSATVDALALLYSAYLSASFNNAIITTLEAHGGGVGVADNTAAFAAAWAVADTIFLGQGVYTIASAVTAPRSNCRIVGLGGANVGANGSTVIKLTAAGAKIAMPISGGGLRDLTIDGNHIATTALSIGGIGAAAGGAAQQYVGVTVNNAAGTNWFIGGLQNSHFDSCQSSGAGGDNLVIDYGAGGLKFTRFESSSGGTSNLLIQQSGASVNVYTTPTHIEFDHCIFESLTGGVAYSTVHLSAGSIIRFDHCGFVTGGAGTTAPIIKIDGTTWIVELSGSFFYAAATQALIGGAGTSGAGYHIEVSGQTYVPGVGVAVFDLTSSYTVAITGQFSPGAPTIPLKTAGTPDFSVLVAGYSWRHTNMPSTGKIVESSGVTGEPALRFARDASGMLNWGPGANGAATDVTLSRKALGVVGTSGQEILATGSGTTALRPAASAALAGAFYANTTTNALEWCDGTTWRTVPVHASSHASGGTDSTDGYQAFTASDTFTVPANVTRLRARAIGGGAGGGAGGVGGNNGASSSGVAYGGVGGGCGAINEQEITVTPGQVLTVTIGAGGAGATSVAAVGAGVTNGTAGSVGGAGGRTSITGTGVNVRADGGDSGSAPTAPVGTTGGSAGVGGVMGGAAGNLQRSQISTPGNGSEYFTKPPTPIGPVGGNPGCYSGATNGGTGGAAPEWGIAALLSTVATGTANGSDAPASAAPAGCGGSGGGAGSKGGSSGAGQPGGGGQVELWWVA